MTYPTSPILGLLCDCGSAVFATLDPGMYACHACGCVWEELDEGAHE